MPSSLPYTEPSITLLLILSSFLFLSNLIDALLNRLLYCGLIGQILLGVAWGTPGANILPQNVQTAVTEFGYLGLVLIVYEGGLSTDLNALRGDLFLSACVAMVGVGLPIGLSFCLQGLMGISALQAFAAGASLCSTSLGTTFTVLTASGLGESRLGVVLTSAAMMDDVVGLVMSAVISSLGTSAESFGAVTVVRPVFVSIAYAVLLPPICAYLVKPLTLFLQRHLGASKAKNGRFVRLLRNESTVILMYTALLFGLVTSADYAGTSVLFAAYLAGVVSTWWDGLIDSGEGSVDEPQRQQTPPSTTAQVISKNSPANDATAATAVQKEDPSRATARQIYQKHFRPATDYVLRPFFFGSIGFAIPISRLFSGAVLWRGVVYSILMIIAKVACGLCLMRFTWPALASRLSAKLRSMLQPRRFWGLSAHRKKKPATEIRPQIENVAKPCEGGVDGASKQAQSAANPPKSRTPRPQSLYPAAMLGGAMVARGEIGFLISSIAETDGIFSGSGGGGGGDGTSEAFLVITWAILICTIIGPVFVGTLVRRVKRLQVQERSQRTGKGDPLGPWGIQSQKARL